jgi:S1-C subfamily serine protease
MKFALGLLAGFGLHMAAPAHSAPSVGSAFIAAESPTVERSADESSAATSGAERLYPALVRIRAVAAPNARSNSAVGREREGTGAVIGNDGLILTIGYLVLEAEDIRITDWHGRSYPARVLAYDHATGLSLLRTSSPLDVLPVPLGDSSKLSNGEPVLVAGWGGIPDTARAQVVSRRRFTSNWEYMLDEAIFTSPATTGWSGAALVDSKGTIVGVGSLLLPEAVPGRQELLGNMFVPINALKPILSDLIKAGRRQGEPRPWLGVGADEVFGRLIVSRVSPESPADRAGVKKGDVILSVGNDPVETRAELYEKLWKGNRAGDVIKLRMLQGAEIRDVDVKSIGRDDYFRTTGAGRPPGSSRVLETPTSYFPRESQEG